jgi:chromosome segregation ATPase
LDFKIEELNRMIDPLNAEIKEHQERIHAMNEELQANENKFTELSLTLSTQANQIVSLTKQESVFKKRSGTYEIRVSSLVSSIQECAKLVGNGRSLSKAVVQLYNLYGGAKASPKQVLEQDFTHQGSLLEREKQRSFLEQRIKQLEEKEKSDENKMRQESGRIMRENVELINQINDIRREIHQLKTEEASKKTTKIELTDTEKV